MLFLELLVLLCQRGDVWVDSLLLTMSDVDISRHKLVLDDEMDLVLVLDGVNVLHVEVVELVELLEILFDLLDPRCGGAHVLLHPVVDILAVSVVQEHAVVSIFDRRQLLLWHSQMRKAWPRLGGEFLKFSLIVMDLLLGPIQVELSVLPALDRVMGQL